MAEMFRYKPAVWTHNEWLVYQYMDGDPYRMLNAYIRSELCAHDMKSVRSLLIRIGNRTEYTIIMNWHRRQLANAEKLVRFHSGVLGCTGDKQSAVKDETCTIRASRNIRIRENSSQEQN